MKYLQSPRDEDIILGYGIWREKYVSACQIRSKGNLAVEDGKEKFGQAAAKGGSVR